MYYNIEESGKRIAELRKKKKLTQEGLAEVIGMSHKTINSIEKGKKGTSIDTLVLIAEALDTSMDYIVTGKIDENSELSRIFQGLSNDKKELALGIRTNSIAQCEQLCDVNYTDLIEKVGKVSKNQLRQITKGIQIQLGMSK